MKTTENTMFVAMFPGILTWTIDQLRKRDDLVGEPAIELWHGDTWKITYEVRDDGDI